MMGIQQGASPTRLLEMLSDRFGAFEAIANSSIKLARVAPEEEWAMDLDLPHTPNVSASTTLEWRSTTKSLPAPAHAWMFPRPEGRRYETGVAQCRRARSPAVLVPHPPP